ncbi:hypothetical protein CEXT_236491 [Caerostris extrusa]|uniref:Uncharacterized protein n=1 Tax=Caerostris extrusa TaxID=172846 RepID=A0AAV4RXS3_CAEEX|nr:hypothetical protein CEXT_236491 [Caerostris extrusa]
MYHGHSLHDGFNKRERDEKAVEKGLLILGNCDDFSKRRKNEFLGHDLFEWRPVPVPVLFVIGDALAPFIIIISSALPFADLYDLPQKRRHQKSDCPQQHVEDSELRRLLIRVVLTAGGRFPFFFLFVHWFQVQKKK